MIRLLSIAIFIGLLAINVQGQEPDNTRPMYGEVIKNDSYKKTDEAFIASALKDNGTIDSSVNVYLQFAWRHFYYNDLTTSMKRFNQVWLLNPNYPDVYFGFAGLLEMTGKKEDAKRFYRMASEKDKDNIRSKICFQRLADCKENLKDYSGTIEAYEKLVSIDSNNAFAFKKLGYFLMDTKDKEKAFKVLSKAIELDPKDAMTYNNRAYLYQSQREYENAIFDYTKAIELDPKDAMTYNNRAYLYQSQREYENAIFDYTKAIELDPKYISAYVNRGLTKMEQLDFQSAKADFEECVRLEENSGELRMFLGQAKLKLQDKQGACADFKLANKLGEKAAKKFIKENCR